MQPVDRWESMRLAGRSASDMVYSGGKIKEIIEFQKTVIILRFGRRDYI